MASRPSGSESYYGYLFNDDKTPTQVLDALLRAIARYIIEQIAPGDNAALDPKRLAAFYKAVGGDYDSLFVDMTHQSISYIWQATGCQHSLQPTGNDFEAPSIPALTTRGFVRWESIEILLGPEEHVPFIQFAVKNWGLKHPDTGEPFPTDLPKESFPAHCDEEIDKWHKACGEQLRANATPKDEDMEPKSAAGFRPEPRPDTKPYSAYAHTRNNLQDSTRVRTSDGRAEHDYFSRKVPYTHVQPKYGPRLSVNRSPDRSRLGADDRTRRRSLSDYASPTQESNQSTHQDSRAGAQRRHSHSRHSHPSSEESGSDSPVSPKSKSRRGGNAPRVRHAGHSPSIPAMAPAPVPPPTPPGLRPHRSEIRADDSRRRSIHMPFDGFREKVALGPLSKHRPALSRETTEQNAKQFPHF